jgi:hypothetical protein
MTKQDYERIAAAFRETPTAARNTREAPIAPAQRAAIDAQTAVYDTPECPCDGLISRRLYNARDEWLHDGWVSAEEAESVPADLIAVDFTYRYPDGEPGLETTVFRADGSVYTSQDFG